MNREHKSRLPEPTGRVGAFLYTVAGGLTVAEILTMLRHVHIIWTR
jgi:hypothetical protein